MKKGAIVPEEPDKAGLGTRGEVDERRVEGAWLAGWPVNTKSYVTQVPNDIFDRRDGVPPPLRKPSRFCAILLEEGATSHRISNPTH